MVDIELIPTFNLGWLSGLILFVIFLVTEGILVLMFPKNARGRLFEYDHSRWSKKHLIQFVIGKSLALVYLALIIFAPLKTGSLVFIFGILLYAIGLIGFVVAVINFKNTPLDQPVTRGVYRISRNPQVVMLFILTTGISLATASWLAFFILVLSVLFSRSRILEEEKACLARYGDSYRNYMKCIPQYFLIKTHVKD